MVKQLKIFFIIAVLSSVLFSGCKKQHSIILFNNDPITKETLLSNSTEFQIGERIYYIFISDLPIKNDIIRVEVRKRDEKVEFWGVKVAYANDYRVQKDQLYYYNDYIVLHDPGHYYMLIYDKENLEKPFAVSDFYVRNKE